MKAIFALLILIFPFVAFGQVPVNDNCSGIINVGQVPFCSNPGQYTNLNATASNIDPVFNIPACFNNPASRDVWFQFSTPADGSITDVSIDIFGDVNGNGTLRMPQVAIYRGDCVVGGLDILDCAAAPLNINQLHLEQFGLTAGATYFLRINDYSASAAPNWGTFKLCITKYVASINIGEAAGSGSCTGTLYDSGGAAEDYSQNEDFSFAICPTEAHQCIVINVVNYSTIQNWDYIRFFQGDNSDTGTEITSLTGAGENFEVQISGACATVQFTSDFFITDAGFEMTWACSPNACTTPPPTTCMDPVLVTLPFDQPNLNNCFSGNSISGGPCDDQFLTGNDYVFSYTSAGDECIHIEVSGTNQGAGIGVYDQCPTVGGATCIGSSGGGFGQIDPIINAAFLENPGTYYIVFGAGENCSPFSITIDTITCPIVLPSASDCNAALNIGGCSTILPEIIALNPGSGDPDFIQDGVNQGCFVNPQQNYAFFYFVAGADGNFGFVVESADPNEASDIDFNVWGPIDSPADICDFVTNNQPVRSSWAPGADPTGLSDNHPVDNTPVDDEFDCGGVDTPSAGGDDFVSTLPVIEGKIYVILLDDFGEAIEQGGIAIDFTETTEGVLNGLDNAVTVSADTAICGGLSVQLLATGGEVYNWTPDNGSLSCTSCPNPIASPTVSTSYQVDIVKACNTVSRVIDVKLYDVTLGPDVTVCNNASFELNPNPFQNVAYAWTGQGLSCTNCPTPTVSGLPTGIYSYIATMTTPNCVLKDTLKINVIDGQQPQYNIASDADLCEGESVSLGGTAFPATSYTWSSIPSGLATTDANPTVNPTQSTVYYLVTTNPTCAVAALDSVILTVFKKPDVQIIANTGICQGDSIQLSTSAFIDGDTYIWSPNDGSFDVNTPNPIAHPTTTTTYTVNATNDGCAAAGSVTISVATISLALSVEDTMRICIGSPLSIVANVAPSSSAVIWTPVFGLTITNNGHNVVANPDETTFYTATLSVPGCVRKETVYVRVDSLPFNMGILPQDTTICAGAQVLLKSKTYDPADFPEITLLWEGEWQLTPDSLYNMVIQPNDTVEYIRIASSGACVDTQRVTVNVIEPAMMMVTPQTTAICPGVAVPLALTYTPGVTDIKWTPANSLNCDTCNNVIATPASTTTYTVEGDFGGCPVMTSATINVNEKPKYKFPEDRILCAGESVKLNEINDPTATYTWTSTDPTFGTNTNAQPNITPTATQTYFLLANNGCSAQDEVKIEVFAGVLTTDGDTTICKNNSAPLKAMGNLPGTFTWTPVNENGQNINVFPQQTTVYTVTYSYANNNCTLTDQVTVTVQGEAPALNFPADKELCPGESVLLNNVPVDPNATYTWTSTPAGFTSTATNPTATPTVSTTYKVTSQLGICSNNGEVTIIAHNSTLSITPDTTVCKGDDMILTAKGSAPNGNYIWSNGKTEASITESPDMDATYSVVYNYGDGCTITKSTDINVVDNFSLSIACDPDTTIFDIGDPLTLLAVVSPTQALTGFKFEWYYANDVVGMKRDYVVETSVNPVNPEDENILLDYKVIATSQYGCKQDASKTINLINPSVKVPNAFTPNGDNVNDTFAPVIKRGKATIESMEIYARWGEKVFESTGINPTWNGTNSQEKNVPMDVYIYVIKWRRGDGALQPVLKGDVTVIR
jgi:gliding motility-associated-like protein